MTKPRVVAICGSTRFIEAIAAAQWWFEKNGFITFAPLYLPPQVAAGPHQAEREDVKDAIDELFLRKVDLADEVFVMDIAYYVGDSTCAEIAYAKARNLPVAFWSKLERGCPLRLAIEGQFPQLGESQ